jgi:prevent-host-death family protein
METIGAFEAKTHFGQLLERTQAGEYFTITKHGLPVAQLMPIIDGDMARSSSAVDEMRAFMKRGLTLGDLSLRAMREEGRK